MQVDIFLHIYEVIAFSVVDHVNDEGAPRTT